MTKQLQSISNKKRKKKASAQALKEIRALQKSTNLIIPAAPLQRIISDVAKTFRSDLRFKGEAYAALHAALEKRLIDLFSKANRIAIHNSRETLQARDLKLALELED